MDVKRIVSLLICVLCVGLVSFVVAQDQTSTTPTAENEDKKAIAALELRVSKLEVRLAELSTPTTTVPTPGLVPFDSCVLNLKSDTRYLKCEFLLGVQENSEIEIAKSIEQIKPKLMNRLILIASDTTHEQLAGKEGLKRLGTIICDSFNAQFKDDFDSQPFKNVLFVDLNVQ